MIKVDKIPNTWGKPTLEELAIFINGKTFSSKDWKGSGVPIIRIQNLKSDDATFNYIDKGAEVESKYHINRGDLLFAWSGTPGTSFGAHIWKGDFSYLNQHIFKVIPFNGVNQKYLFYALNSLISSFVERAQGTAGLAHITKAELESTICPLPSSNEQNRIVEKLDELLSELEKGNEQLQTSLEQLKVYRQSVLKSAFEGKMTGNANTPVVNLSEVIEQPRYGTSRKCDYNVIGTGVLRIPNIKDGYIDTSDLKFATFESDEIEAFALNVGDILSIRSNGSISLVGKSAIVSEREKNLLFAGYLIRLRPIAEKIVPKYLLWLLSSQPLRVQIEAKAKSTSGVNNINSEELKALRIPLPTPNQQQQIVSEIESRISVCDRLINDIEESLRQSEILKKSLLQKAFEGKLVSQDQNDGAVSVLLEKIKIGREQYLIERKEYKKLVKAKTIKMAEELKRIVEVLKESKKPVSSKTLWQSSVYKHDIDDFYTELKKHIEAGEIKETRRGRESLLELVAKK